MPSWKVGEKRPQHAYEESGKGHTYSSCLNSKIKQKERLPNGVQSVNISVTWTEAKTSVANTQPLAVHPTTPNNPPTLE